MRYLQFVSHSVITCNCWGCADNAVYVVSRS